MAEMEIVKTVLYSVGGGGAIIVLLSAFLGKIWAKRIADTEKAAHDSELARLKSSLEIEQKRIETVNTQLAQLSFEIDIDLRERRIQAYKDLWEATGLLPKWPKADNVTYEKLGGLSELLRDWYFTKGGMYTSRTTHDKGYSPLQDEIQDVLKDGGLGLIKDEDYERIRKRCSRLRTELTNDILSRRTLDPGA